MYVGELQSKPSGGPTRGCELIYPSFSDKMLQLHTYCCGLHMKVTADMLCLSYLPIFGPQQPEIFFSVMSKSTWSDVLSDSQRQHLRQFLPQFPDNNISEQDSTISDLFNNRNFNFGNPLHLAQKLFRGAS